MLRCPDTRVGRGKKSRPCWLLRVPMSLVIFLVTRPLFLFQKRHTSTSMIINKYILCIVYVYTYLYIYLYFPFSSSVGEETEIAARLGIPVKDRAWLMACLHSWSWVQEKNGKNHLDIKKLDIQSEPLPEVEGRKKRKSTEISLEPRDGNDQEHASNGIVAAPNTLFPVIAVTGFRLAKTIISVIMKRTSQYSNSCVCSIFI